MNLKINSHHSLPRIRSSWLIWDVPNNIADDCRVTESARYSVVLRRFCSFMGSTAVLAHLFSRSKDQLPLRKIALSLRSIPNGAERSRVHAFLHTRCNTGNRRSNDATQRATLCCAKVYVLHRAAQPAARRSASRQALTSHMQLL